MIRSTQMLTHHWSAKSSLIKHFHMSSARPRNKLILSNPCSKCFLFSFRIAISLPCWFSHNHVPIPTPVVTWWIGDSDLNASHVFWLLSNQSRLQTVQIQQEGTLASFYNYIQPDKTVYRVYIWTRQHKGGWPEQSEQYQSRASLLTCTKCILSCNASVQRDYRVWKRQRFSSASTQHSAQWALSFLSLAKGLNTIDGALNLNFLTMVPNVARWAQLS